MQSLDDNSPAILDTTELRWFVPGPMPTEIESWFSGSTGVRSERCDTYLVDGRSDVGVKRRFGETLELKIRGSLDGGLQLTESLTGALEVWRRWSPADGLVADDCGGPRIEVCKTIVKRRFSLDGTEIAFTSDAEATGAGCDVEVAAVSVGAEQWWSFAFAAFGPEATRRDAIVASWQALVSPESDWELIAPGTGRAMGYPEWLALMTCADGADRATEPSPCEAAH